MRSTSARLQPLPPATPVKDSGSANFPPQPLSDATENERRRKLGQEVYVYEVTREGGDRYRFWTEADADKSRSLLRSNLEHTGYIYVGETKSDLIMARWTDRESPGAVVDALR